MNVELALTALSRLGADWVLWLLVLLSVAGLAVIVERGVCFWTTRDDVARLSDELAKLLAAGEWQRIDKLLSESPSYEAKVARAALGQTDPHGADQLMLGACETMRLDLERHLSFLATLGSNAPFVGLLGTVVGIIGAFRQLDASGGAFTDGLMSEIGEALVATAVGLLVALPAIAAFNLYRGVVQARLGRADALRRRVLGQLWARQEA